MSTAVDLRPLGIEGPEIVRNPSAPRLYEHALLYDEGSAIAQSGALISMSGKKTGRSPKDKRVVVDDETKDDIWWGSVNRELSPESFGKNRAMAIEFLNEQERLYVIDAFAGWAQKHRIKVRIVCARPYHALFMTNMLIRPTAAQLAEFGEPDYVVLNAGRCQADPEVDGVKSKTSVALSFAEQEFVILGTEYAGEMKKGIFTVMNYLMPKRGVLSMHCSANEDDDGDVSLFFGLSGTGKTTLSADPRRHLIGDDEHCWSDEGVFNIEGGCYAKCIKLSAEKEPEIYAAIRFGSVLENVVYDEETRVVDYDSSEITLNTRASYPIEFIPNAKIPCNGGQPKNVILLTCDAFGVMPPVAKLGSDQAMYHFISGYTSKVAGTEVGVTEPEATFSACYGAPFLVWHPMKYAALLAEKLEQHGAHCWLVNTGWSGGAYPKGGRIDLPYTRAIIDAIHDGSLAKAETRTDPTFGFLVPTSCAGVPDELLDPRGTWDDAGAYDDKAAHLAGLFQKNFEKFADGATEDVRNAGPTG